MFEKNEEIQDAIDKLYQTFGHTERGTTIPWPDLEQAMGHNHLTYPGNYIVGRFRVRLAAEKDVLTRCANGVGVRLLTHEQATREIPAMRQKRAYRQCNRALHEMDHIDTAVLTTYMRRVAAQAQHNLRYQRLHLGRSKREFAREIHKTPVNPRRAVGGPQGATDAA